MVAAVLWYSEIPSNLCWLLICLVKSIFIVLVLRSPTKLPSTTPSSERSSLPAVKTSARRAAWGSGRRVSSRWCGRRPSPPRRWLAPSRRGCEMSPPRSDLRSPPPRGRPQRPGKAGSAAAAWRGRRSMVPPTSYPAS